MLVEVDLVERSEGVVDLDHLVAEIVGMNTMALHGRQGNELYEVVLHHVAQGAAVS
jgi:DNA-binding protein Fis